jgi:hypothetical protein
VDWLGPAAADFDGFVTQARRSDPLEGAEAGGHVGYHVVTPGQRQGHATRMLAAGLVLGEPLGLDRVLLTAHPITSHRAGSSWPMAAYRTDRAMV